MKPKKRIQEMTFAALLTAIAILIPSIMPIKLIIPPASLYLRESRSIISSYVYISLGGSFCYLSV